MKIIILIEKYFWMLLIAGIILGLCIPVPFEAPFATKVLLWFMLFFVFLKIDALKVLENIRNYRLMIYIVSFYMIIIPLLFFFSIRIFDSTLATGILLLTAVPAGVSSPALTDIVKGNSSLSMSLVILTQLVAPVTIPLLFWIVDIGGLEMNELAMFRDIALIVLMPMVTAQIIKKSFPDLIARSLHLFTSANVLLIFALVFIAISSQREVILENPQGLIWKVALLYLIFIILHFVGYMLCYNQPGENRIAVAVSAAYMNNGMAIVLAASYFKPEILVLMVLSEIPWNTLVAPFRRVLKLLQ